jgi:hypothetical protein
MNWDIFPCRHLIYHRWILKPMMILPKVTLLMPVANPNAEA